MKKKKKQNREKITIADYIKAVKKADREIQLETQVGWVSIHKVHQSKKAYNRKVNKRNYLED